MTERTPAMPDKVQTSARIDRELLEEVQIACVKRRVSQMDAIEAGLRLWLILPKGLEAAAGEEMGEYVQYPVHLRPVIDELLTILNGKPEGKYHAMVQALLKEALLDLP